MSNVIIDNKNKIDDRAAKGLMSGSSILWNATFADGNFLKRSGSYLSSGDVGLLPTQTVADESERLAILSASTVIQTDDNHVYLAVPGIDLSTTYGWIDLGAKS